MSDSSAPSSHLTPQALFRRRLLDQDPAAHTTGWEDVLVPYGVALAGAAFQDNALIDWAERWFAHHHAAGYVIGKPVPPVPGSGPRRGHFIGDYCGNWGGPLVFAALQRARPDPFYIEATRTVCEGLLNQANRFDDGTFAHGDRKYGIWVDTLFYCAPVLAEAFAVTSDRRYAEEAVRQVRLHSKWLRDPLTGGWFHDVHPESGVRTEAFWSRGNGWIILSLADTLRLCPSDLPGWHEALADYRSLVTCMLRFQHPCGFWRIVPEHENAHLESSGTAMILAGLVTGLSAGWLEKSVRLPVMRGVSELLTWIDERGALQGAQRPAGPGGWDVHKLSTLGECTYANGMLWRLLADLRHAGFIGADFLQTR